MSCAVQCPADKGFELRSPGIGLMENGTIDRAPMCVYTRDPRFYVTLTALPWVMNDIRGRPVSIADLETVNPNVHRLYQQENARVEQALTVQYGKIDSDEKLKHAFEDLQDAENVRDESPDAYQGARVKYYTLLKGDTWKEQEKTRIMKAEAAPVVGKYANEYVDLVTRNTEQQGIIEVMNMTRDKVLSMKDNLGFSVDKLSKHIDAVRNQVQVHRRLKEYPVQITSWTDTLLNALIAIIAVVAIVLLIRKLTDPAFQSPPLPTRNSRGY